MATPFNFVTPIRYFKANDPYYYEVDNLPLRQLEENILYVKDKLARAPDPDEEISIYNIKELRPKVGSGDRVVSVNAGRFIGRQNDLYDMNPTLAHFIRSKTAKLPDVIPDLEQLWDEERRNKVFEDFLGNAASKAYNTNGLETGYTFYTTPGNGIGSNFGVEGHIGVGANYPYYAGMGGGWKWKNKWPNIMGNLGRFLGGQPWLGVDITRDTTYIAEALPTLHLAFTQMWRGIFRTAVVDVPDCDLQVPPFRAADFFYFDKDDKRVLIPGATHRIDLLVVYNLPIDASSTTIVDYQAGISSGQGPQGYFTPKKLTQPTLGLVMGAGMGIKKWEGAHHTKHRPFGLRVQDAHGRGTGGTVSKAIIPSVSDQDPLANVGITKNDINGSKIHGSFPSPDDLLNIAPILALDINADGLSDLGRLQLVGQTCMPIAYILVEDRTKLVQSDIIDIRPFLRTTEFTYNERAGVAAANPPLSLANPAVGAFQVQKVVEALEDKISSAEGGGGGGGEKARPLYTDYIMGGLAYGVEGTLLTMCDNTSQGADDPFGTGTTTTNSFTSAGPGAPTFDFSWAKSSKDFMEKDSLRDKQALLEYFYRMRQGDLKVWLANPNSTYSTANGTYLGLPRGASSRNIPLYPEWDMPIDENSYKTVVLGKADASPPETLWMWIEGQSIDRPMAYAPGSLVLNTTGSKQAWLRDRVGVGWGRNPHSSLGRGSITSVSKSIDVVFPEWVEDYDVIAEYVNCAPITMAFPYLGGEIQNANTAGQYGLGAGISVNKSTLAGSRATITINSVASPYPEGNNGILTNTGMIGDVSGPSDLTTGAAQRASAPTYRNSAYQWLAYTVCLPQFAQTHFNCMRQIEGTAATVTRFTPKFGAAIYPTVKFTIIGYPSQSSSSERYGTTNHFGLIQEVAIGNQQTLIGGLPPLGGRADITIT